jgi:hypothetical protein
MLPTLVQDRCRSAEQGDIIHLDGFVTPIMANNNTVEHVDPMYMMPGVVYFRGVTMSKKSGEVAERCIKRFHLATPLCNFNSATFQPLTMFKLILTRSCRRSTAAGAIDPDLRWCI